MGFSIVMMAAALLLAAGEDAEVSAWGLGSKEALTQTQDLPVAHGCPRFATFLAVNSRCCKCAAKFLQKRSKHVEADWNPTPIMWVDCFDFDNIFAQQSVQSDGVFYPLQC